MAYTLDYTGQEVDAHISTPIPTKTSDLNNDSGFISRSVNNLVNYYLKSETYTKAEVAALIGAIQQFHYEIYASLSEITEPAGNVLYLIGPTGSGADKYEEYVYASGAFVKIGDTSIDLSNYVTITALNTALANYTTTENLTELLASKADKVAGANAGNLVSLDANGNLKDSGITADNVAQMNRDYQQMSVGSSHGVLGGSVEQVFTRTAVPSNTGEGAAVIDTIKGKTLKWNQLFYNGDASDGTTGWQTGNAFAISAGTDYIRITQTGTATSGMNILAITPPKWIKKEVNHKYLIAFDYKVTTSKDAYSFGLYFCAVYGFINATLNSWSRNTRIVTAAGSVNTGMFLMASDAQLNEGETIDFKNIICIDLTDFFGSGNEPTTVEEFEALYPLPYYAYNAGTLLPFKGTGLKTVGFNQWDEQWEVGTIDNSGNDAASNDRIRSKGYTRVLPSTTYYIKVPNNAVVHFYDINKVWISSTLGILNTNFTTPANAAYIRFRLVGAYGTTYKNDICINISNPALNGTYKPYEEYILSLPIIGKTAKDSNGNPIVPFPEEMNGVGTAYDVARNADGSKVMGSVDLGTCTFVESSQVENGFVIIDGVSDMKLPANFATEVPAVITPRYVPQNFNNLTDKGICYRQAPSAGYLIKDSAFAGYTAEQVKAALSGVYLVYELATPVPFTWDEPLNLNFPVQTGGVIILLPENTSTPTTAPIVAKTAYPHDPEYTAAKGILDALKAANKISNYTITWNGTTGQYAYTVS